MPSNIKKSNFIILLPLYNDWENLRLVIKKIEKTTLINKFNIKILIINDCSTHKEKIKNKFLNIEILNLSSNLGSQRAIAIGLKFIKKKYANKYSFTVIMDSDGQDDPKVINKLVKLFNPQKDKVIVVQRTNRKENLWFRILYIFYKISFTLLTWKSIKFGNFSLINNNYLNLIVKSDSLWAAYPAAIIKNFNKIKKINSERQERYKGNTKMNFVKLFDHALRVFLVFKKNIFFISTLYLFIFLIFFNNYKVYLFSIYCTINLILYIKSLINLTQFKQANKKIKITLNKY